jgi:hypothetical protein
MVHPSCLCTWHLNGEHGELHKHHTHFVKQRSIKRRYGQIEPLAMKRRHDALVEEMLSRGWKHNSPFEMPDLSYLSDYDREGKVDTTVSTALLSLRCMACNDRLQNFLTGKAQRRRLLESIRSDFTNLRSLVDQKDINTAEAGLMGAIRSGWYLGILSQDEANALYRRARQLAT